jgi:PTH1 family peptidyl-tRNA hydrolase
LGFAVVECLAERHGISLGRHRAESRCGSLVLGDEKVWLVQPQTFMNRSGTVVRRWLEMEPCEPQNDLVIVADDLDLPQGAIRVRQRGGSGGHHGLESIIEAIGTKEFARIRIGIDPGQEMEDPVSYLLRPMRVEQRRQMEAVVEQAADAAEVVVRDGAAKAMNRFNRRREDREMPASPQDAGRGSKREVER